MPARGASALARDGERFSAGELRQWGGTAWGTVKDFAGALERTPKTVLKAVEETGVELMVDTARPDGKSSKHHDDRPEDPERRSLAFTTEAFEAVVEAV